MIEVITLIVVGTAVRILRSTGTSSGLEPPVWRHGLRPVWFDGDFQRTVPDTAFESLPGL